MNKEKIGHFGKCHYVYCNQTRIMELITPSQYAGASS